MSASRSLRPHLAEIVAHVTAARASWAPLLVEHLQRSLADSDSRALAAGVRSRARSVSVRAGIRHAVGVLHVERRGIASIVQRRIELKGPEHFGLRRVPDIETIRSELRRMLAERKARASTPEPAHASTGKQTIETAEPNEDVQHGSEEVCG